MKISFAVNSATIDQLYEHLCECSDSFMPSLHETVDIHDYSSKLASRAHRVEAWSDDKLIGLVCGYLNNTSMDFSFITNVSTHPSWTSKGVGFELMTRYLILSKTNNFSRVRLEVNTRNTNAIALYKRLSFKEVKMEEEKIVMEYNMRGDWHGQ